MSDRLEFYGSSTETVGKQKDRFSLLKSSINSNLFVSKGLNRDQHVAKEVSQTSYCSDIKSTACHLSSLFMFMF